MLRATLKSLLARKVRLLLSGLAVVLGVMFVSGAFVLTDTLSRSFNAIFADAYEGVDVNITAKPKTTGDGTPNQQITPSFPADTLARVDAQPGVAEATGLVVVEGARLIGSNGKVVPSLGPPQLGGNWLGESDLVQLREGRGPRADDEVVVNAALAEAARVSVGDRVGVLTLEPKREFTLVGVFGYSGGRDSIGGAHEVMFTTPVAQRLMLGQPDTYNSISVRAADGVRPETLRDELAGVLGAEYEVQTGAQAAEAASAGLREGLSFFNQILLGFAAVALLVGTFLILNTFSIIVAQRTRELALMRAIGASGRQIVGSVILEALAVGLLASVLGLAAGIGVGALLAYLFGELVGGLNLAGLAVPPAAVVSSFAVGMLITLVAALLPALRAARIPPIAAMQDVATPDRPLTKVTVAGTAVTSVGAVLLTLGLTGNAGGQALPAILGGVLFTFVGVALLTPLISRPVVSLLGLLFAWSVPGKLGRLNSGRNPRRTAITAAALMVGIALVTGVTVVLDSAKSTLAGQVEDTVHAELAISGAQTGPRQPTFDPAVVDRAAELPGVQTAVGLFNDMVEIDGQRRYINAVTDLAALQRVYGTQPTAGGVDSLRPDQVAIRDWVAKEQGTSVGDPITIQFDRGARRTFTVAAIYPEKDLPATYVLARQAAVDFTVPQAYLALVQLADGANPEQVRSQLDALLVDSPEVSVVDRAAYIKQRTGGFDQLLTMIQILLALAIVIAVLGIINTLALSVLERTRELGLLRAIGLRRSQTMRMITVEAVVISVFGALLGVLVGAGLGSAVVQALKDEGITELVLPWTQMGVFLGLAALVGVIAAVLPATRAARINVLGAIAHD